MKNIHASAISYKNKGIMFIGPSGSGKSDICLRFIIQRGAVLIADDRLDICKKNGEIVGSCPKEIKGLLEVRGIGIRKVEFKDEFSISLVVELVKNLSDISRMPEVDFFKFENIKVPKIKIYPFEVSSLDKIEIAL